jgi:hypothetical protein
VGSGRRGEGKEGRGSHKQIQILALKKTKKREHAEHPSHFGASCGRHFGSLEDFAKAECGRVQES